MKIRAAVLSKMGLPGPYATSKPLSIQSVELAPPGEDEVLVRVLAAGLCHSDLSVIDGSRPRPMPMVLGHEGVGEVVALGPGDIDLMIGDHVVFCFVPSCGFCEFCSQGRPSLCKVGARANATGELTGGGRRLQHADDSLMHHHLGVSAFAEMTVVSTRSVVRIDKTLPVDVAAVFGCAVLTGVGAVVNTAKVAPGESVAIFGMGGIGLAVLLGAKATGAYPIMAIDVQSHKLELAQKLGATHTFRADLAGDLPAGIKTVTEGGPDFSFETVGSEKVLQQAYLATKRGGTTIALGLPHPDKMLTIPAVSLVAEERTLKGSYMGSSVPSRDIPRYIALYRAGNLPVDKLITHRIKLDEINEGFDRLAAGEGARQVVIG